MSDSLAPFLDYPIQAPPAGVTPNFVDPSSLAYIVYITAGVCIPLMVVFSLARFVYKVSSGARAINADEGKSRFFIRSTVHAHITNLSMAPV